MISCIYVWYLTVSSCSTWGVGLSLVPFPLVTFKQSWQAAGEMSEICVLAAATLQTHFDVGERAKSLHAAVST